MNTKITVATGDGIGPEIMSSVISILKAANCPLDYEYIEVGEKVYLQGFNSGISDKSWDTIYKNKAFLKAPISTPQGGGYKSLNVTLRKALGLYANLRPTKSYAPILKNVPTNMDIVIIRENEEDLYSGMEYRNTNDSFTGVKLITKAGSERIIRYAFEYAQSYSRGKVTCMVKDNIMKLTDGTFRKIFDLVGAEYPKIEKEHFIVDIGAARIAKYPERFDVLVTENLYGDIISDIVAEVGGSVGLCGSANIGVHVAMFEAIHGSAPDIAGRGIANPSGLLQSAVMMLNYLGLFEYAKLIFNSWAVTIESGLHTGDMKLIQSLKIVNTVEFTDAIIKNLGQTPNILKYNGSDGVVSAKFNIEPDKSTQELFGVDVFVKLINVNEKENALKDLVEIIKNNNLNIEFVANRGIRIWPDSPKFANLGDMYQIRFLYESTIKYSEVLYIMDTLNKFNCHILKTENLYKFDGVVGFSSPQGQ